MVFFTRLKVLACVVPLLASAAVVASASPASATACTGAVTFSTSSNAIYLNDASHPYTLATVLAACPSIPLVQVDPVAHIWELRADLIVQNGATLDIDGQDATSPVSELRLRSLSDGAFNHVTQLEADYGTLNLNAVHVRSWDDATGAPDTDPTLPACPSGTKTSQCPRGRAYIRALSSLAADGTTWDESTMNITNSEVDHLGFYQPTSYGVSYKTESGCDHLHTSLCGHVFGEELNSNFHDNYMGTYTWGAEGIKFLGNQYAHNFMYGLDPHDVSNDLDIENNHMSYNGDHGLICAEACANLRIINNESDHNGLVPWKGPTLDEVDHLVHGIMLYRGDTGAVIMGNSVHDQPNGSGIAVFDTSNTSISANQLANNVYGVQLSVGSAANQITNNAIASSSQYGIYLYRGSDAPAFSTPSGRPTGNIISGNTITTTGSNGIKLNEADANIFSSNTVTGASGSLYFAGAAGNTLQANTLTSSQKISSVATANGPSSTVVQNPATPVGVSIDASSSTDLDSSNDGLFTASGRALLTQVSPTGSVLHLTAAILGTNVNVSISPNPVTVSPASDTALARVAGSGSTTDITIQETMVTAVSISSATFSPGHTYTVLRNGIAIGPVTADATGNVAFSDTPPAAGTYDYTFQQ